jgi:hypothetical protein
VDHLAVAQLALLVASLHWVQAVTVAALFEFLLASTALSV